MKDFPDDEVGIFVTMYCDVHVCLSLLLLLIDIYICLFFASLVVSVMLRRPDGVQ